MSLNMTDIIKLRSMMTMQGILYINAPNMHRLFTSSSVPICIVVTFMPWFENKKTR